MSGWIGRRGREVGKEEEEGGRVWVQTSWDGRKEEELGIGGWVGGKVGGRVTVSCFSFPG